MTAIDRAVGMLLGAASGDALGWPQELRGGIVGGKTARMSAEPQPRFRDWARRGGNRFSGTYIDPVRAGEYSDDTQLICAVARATLKGPDWLDWLQQVELPSWRLYQRGGGGAVLAAASSWSQRRPPWAGEGSSRSADSAKRWLNAGGNGVAMRIAPHVIWTTNRQDSPDALAQRVLFDGLSTHGHPRALIGALAYAFALSGGYRNEGTLDYGSLVDAARLGVLEFDDAYRLFPEGIWDFIEINEYSRTWNDAARETRDLFDIVEREIAMGSMANEDHLMEAVGALGPHGGAGHATAAAAIFIASRSAARPLSGLVSAAFLRDADTDTLCSMVGALLGSIHGTGWLRPFKELQDATYIENTATALHRGATAPVAAWPAMPIDKSGRRIVAALFNEEAASSGIFADGREYRVISMELLDQGSGMHRAFLNLEDGQTLLIDRKAEFPGLTRAEIPTERPQIEDRSAVLDAPIDAPPALAQITLATRDVYRVAQFYSQIFGRNVRVNDGEVLIATGIRIRQVDGDWPASSPNSTIVDVLVNNIDRTAEALGTYVDRSGKRAVAFGLDPDGRLVRVSGR